MSCNEKLIDTATDASPPQIRTRDIGCSPVHFGPSIRSTSGSGGCFDRSPILLNQKQQNTTENIVMKKYILFVSISRFEKTNKKTSSTKFSYLISPFDKRLFERTAL